MPAAKKVRKANRQGKSIGAGAGGRITKSRGVATEDKEGNKRIVFGRASFTVKKGGKASGVSGERGMATKRVKAA